MSRNNSNKNKSKTVVPELEGIDAIMQELHREYLHPLGLKLTGENGKMTLEKAYEQPYFDFNLDVTAEIEKVKFVQDMRNINMKDRRNKLYFGVQPVQMITKMPT